MELFRLFFRFFHAVGNTTALTSAQGKLLNYLYSIIYCIRCGKNNATNSIKRGKSLPRPCLRPSLNSSQAMPILQNKANLQSLRVLFVAGLGQPPPPVATLWKIGGGGDARIKAVGAGATSRRKKKKARFVFEPGSQQMMLSMISTRNQLVAQPPDPDRIGRYKVRPRRPVRQTASVISRKNEVCVHYYRKCRRTNLAVFPPNK